MFGSRLFNAAYSVALMMLYESLKKADICLKLPCFACSPLDDRSVADSEPESFERVVDAVFVDDECIALLATSP